MAIKGTQRLFKVIQTMDSDTWDPERCDYLDNIDQNKVRLYDRDAGLYESEIAKDTILTESEMKNAVLAMEESQYVFDYIKEVTIAEEILNKLFEKNTISYYDCRDYKVEEEVALLDVREIKIYDPENDDLKGGYHVLTYDDDSFESAYTQIELTEEETEYLIKIKKGANNVN